MSMSMTKDKSKSWSLEHILEIPGIQTLISPALAREERFQNGWVRNCLACFNTGDAYSGMLDLVEADDPAMFCINGGRVRVEDEPSYVVMNNPSFRDLRFNCGRDDDDDDDDDDDEDNNKIGCVMVVNLKTDAEIKRIDCRTPQGRRELFEFLIGWARANPAPASVSRPKKRTAAAILAEGALKSRGRRLGRHARETLGRSGLSEVTEEVE